MSEERVAKGELFVQRGKGIVNGTLEQRRAWALAAPAPIVVVVVGVTERSGRVMVMDVLAGGLRGPARAFESERFHLEYARLV